MIELFRKHISLHGCGRSTRAMFSQVQHLMATGEFRPVVHARFGLAEAAAAHRLMESRAFRRMIMVHGPIERAPGSVKSVVSSP